MTTPLPTERYVRKPFYIDAIRVTHENMQAVAEWCGGEIKEVKDPVNGEIKERFIKVNVLHALSERQKKGYSGDWVLFAGTGFKVYKHKAFLQSFLPLEGDHIQENSGGVVVVTPQVQNVFDNDKSEDLTPEQRLLTDIFSKQEDEPEPKKAW